MNTNYFKAWSPRGIPKLKTISQFSGLVLWHELWCGLSSDVWCNTLWRETSYGLPFMPHPLFLYPFSLHLPTLCFLILGIQLRFPKSRAVLLQGQFSLYISPSFLYTHETQKTPICTADQLIFCFILQCFWKPKPYNYLTSTWHVLRHAQDATRKTPFHVRITKNRWVSNLSGVMTSHSNITLKAASL